METNPLDLGAGPYRYEDFLNEADPCGMRDAANMGWLAGYAAALAAGGSR